jgi:L-seryl-tRNA(Ser) seleniumtransferase
VTSWIREVLADLRRQALTTTEPTGWSPDAIVCEVVRRLVGRAEAEDRQRQQPVINGTGVLLHTNLGRAPLAEAAIEAVRNAAGYASVEVDLSTGHRGPRGARVARLLQELTGGESALVVNNCAAATWLTLHALGSGREVIVSRGQLVEIGGSYRLPDIFQAAGVVLREVGTTNRTRLSDYACALNERTAALLRVHPSNYRIIGFAESVAIADLVNLASTAGARDTDAQAPPVPRTVLPGGSRLPVIDDLGSGCLYDLSAYGLMDEPQVQVSLEAGASVVLFSGDKLLGGPQCGVIVGRRDLLDHMRASPLARAMRVDKLTLAALEATLELHLAGRAFCEIPVLRMIAEPASRVRERAEQLLGRMAGFPWGGALCIGVEETQATLGGGSVPGQVISSWGISARAADGHADRLRRDESGNSPPLDTDELARRLRTGHPAVMPVIRNGRVLIDMRTVLPEQESDLLRRIVELVSPSARDPAD